MKSLQKNIYLSVIAALAAACSPTSDAPVEPDRGDKSLAMGLYVTVSDEIPSRATPEGDYNRGEGNENYIDLTMGNHDVRVLVYDTDSRLVLDIDNPLVTPYESYAGSKTYLLQFDVDNDFREAFEGKSFKLVMMANFRHSYNVAANLSNLSVETGVRALYSGPPTPLIDTSDPIMMYGVSSFGNITFEKNMLNIMGTLHLLRAMAKIEVFDAPSSLPVKKVTLTRHNSEFYPVPANVTHQDDYVKGNYDDDYTLRPTTGPDDEPFRYESAEPTVLNSIKDSNGISHYIIYVPEYANLGVDGNPRLEDKRARLQLDYETGTFFIDFKYYGGSNAGRHFNIMRNWWYRFEVNVGESSPEVTVDVIPYAAVDLDPSFGICTDECHH